MHATLGLAVVGEVVRAERALHSGQVTRRSFLVGHNGVAAAVAQAIDTLHARSTTFGAVTVACDLAANGADAAAGAAASGYRHAATVAVATALWAECASRSAELGSLTVGAVILVEAVGPDVTASVVDVRDGTVLGAVSGAAGGDVAVTHLLAHLADQVAIDPDIDIRAACAIATTPDVDELAGVVFSVFPVPVVTVPHHPFLAASGALALAQGATAPDVLAPRRAVSSRAVYVAATAVAVAVASAAVVVGVLLPPEPDRTVEVYTHAEEPAPALPPQVPDASAPPAADPEPTPLVFNYQPPPVPEALSAPPVAEAATPATQAPATQAPVTLAPVTQAPAAAPAPAAQAPAAAPAPVAPPAPSEEDDADAPEDEEEPSWRERREERREERRDERRNPPDEVEEVPLTP